LAKSIKVHCGVLGISFLLAVDFSQAGPPFVTDDPEPPPPGGWEINVPFILERTPGKTEMDTPLFDLNYGLPDIQLKLEFPIEIVNEDSNGMQAGLGDSLIGVKWRFFNNERSQVQFGIYPHCCCQQAIMRAASATVGLPSYFHCSRRETGKNGRFTQTLVIGGKLVPKCAITFTRAL
jgi:hypothetical protein